MRDPWKYVAFPLAAVAGFALSATSLTVYVGNTTGLGNFLSQIIVVAASGLIAGFLVDEIIPAYVEKIRERRGGAAAGDFGGDDIGGGDDDFDFE